MRQSKLLWMLIVSIVYFIIKIIKICMKVIILDIKDKILVRLIYR